MKNKNSDLDQRFLLLFKIDATNLFKRIKERRSDYIEAFSLKRNRAVFKDVFDSRYQKASVEDLSHCPLEIIETMDQFYSEADKLFWYLKHTQDMPNTIEDELVRRITRLSKSYELLSLYIDAELSGNEMEEVDTFEELPPNDREFDSFMLEGELDAVEAEREYLQEETFPPLDDIEGEGEMSDDESSSEKKEEY